jgi:hypothetical protein
MFSLKKIFQKEKIIEKIGYNDANSTDSILFIHIPKNAGTSIAKDLGFKSTTHIKASEIKKEYVNGFIEDRFSFAIVRNPIDRFISLYNYARMDISYYHNNIDPEKSIYGKHLDYELLKNSSLLECAHYLKKGMLKHDIHWNHWEPQYNWVYDVNSRQQLVKKIYNFENLQELVKDMNSMFNFKFELSEINKSKREDNKKKIDLETISILKEYYKKDFDLFDYK